MTTTTPVPVRVLLVAAATSTSGGGERHVADLLAGLPERGVTVGLVSPYGSGLPEIAEGLGISAYTAAIGTGLSAERVRGVRDAIARFAPDVVHAHGSRAAAFARLADSRARTRVVYTLHGIHIAQAGSPLRKAAFLSAERLLRPRTACFITVADSDAEKGARLGVLDRSLTSTVYNGIDVPAAVSRGTFRAEMGIAPEAPLVLSVGRFHAQKDQATLIRSFADVVENYPDARLVIIGSGELEGTLRESIVARDLSRAVTLVAPRPNLASAYADADVFALSSLWEGLPYVVLEAMASGTPVVSTCVDGIPEAVEDGRCGLLVEPGDSPALGRALTQMLGSRAVARQMGEAARAIVEERFAKGRMLDRLATIYREVAQGGGRP